MRLIPVPRHQCMSQWLPEQKVSAGVHVEAMIYNSTLLDARQRTLQWTCCLPPYDMLPNAMSSGQSLQGAPSGTCSRPLAGLTWSTL